MTVKELKKLIEYLPDGYEVLMDLGGACCGIKTCIHGEYTDFMFYKANHPDSPIEVNSICFISDKK